MSERKRGPKPRLTPEVIDKIDQAWRVGATDPAAAGFAGISTATFYAIMAAARQDAAGDDPDNPLYHSPKMRALLRELWAKKEAAQGTGQVRLLALIEGAAKKDWRAAQALLEMRFRSEFGRRAVAVEGNPDGVPVTVRHVVVLPNEEEDADAWEQRAAAYTAKKAVMAAIAAAAVGEGGGDSGDSGDSNGE